jgi:hypothetical protein
MLVDGPVSQSPDAGDPPSASKHNDSLPDECTIPRLLFLTHEPASLSPPFATESRTPTPQSQDPDAPSDQNSSRQVVPRSRWQTVLLEAGGIGAAVSEESMRRLKYCLQWLQVRPLETSTWCTFSNITFTVRHDTHRLSDPYPPRLYRLPPILCRRFIRIRCLYLANTHAHTA